MQFTPKFFDPALLAPPQGAGDRVVLSFPKADPPSLYVYDTPLVLAINVALATRRPLLLAGEPGSGKTTLARNVALAKKWAYYNYTVSSRSQASELLWDVDTLGRLNDAYHPQRTLLDEACYVVPGPMWWAIAPSTAGTRGLPDDHPQLAMVRLPDPPGHQAAGGAVLLIDEIDKAEPDVPNDLLEVLDTRSFSVRARRIPNERADLLICITTNLERDLPAAFLRRCVVYRMPEPPAGWFADIAGERHPRVPRALAETVEARLREVRTREHDRGLRPPGTAEYLDAVAALSALGVTTRDDDAMRAAWDAIEHGVFNKHDTLEGA